MNKKAKGTVIILFLIMFTINCGTVIVSAPPQKDVRLLSDTDYGTYKTTMRCWYLLFGLIPISNNSTAEKIAQHNLKNVKVKTYHGAIDIIIDLLLGGLIMSETVEIEGNISK